MSMVRAPSGDASGLTPLEAAGHCLRNGGSRQWAEVVAYHESALGDVARTLDVLAERLADEAAEQAAALLFAARVLREHVRAVAA